MENEKKEIVEFKKPFIYEKFVKQFPCLKNI